MEFLPEDKQVALTPSGSVSVKSAEYINCNSAGKSVYTGLNHTIVSYILYLQTKPLLNYSAHLFQEKGC